MAYPEITSAIERQKRTEDANSPLGTLRSRLHAVAEFVQTHRPLRGDGEPLTVIDGVALIGLAGVAGARIAANMRAADAGKRVDALVDWGMATGLGLTGGAILEHGVMQPIQRAVAETFEAITADPYSGLN